MWDGCEYGYWASAFDPKRSCSDSKLSGRSAAADAGFRGLLVPVKNQISASMLLICLYFLEAEMNRISCTRRLTPQKLGGALRYAL